MLSWEETNVPDGQASTQAPFDKKVPGTQLVHWACDARDAILKFGILQVVHFTLQASHAFLLLSAIRLVPSQTPSLFALTQTPLSMYWPWTQAVQSFDVPPEHDWHGEAHGWQEVPFENASSGHVVPVDVIWGSGLQVFWSFWSWENPDLQERQAPVLSAHWVHPTSQAESRLTRANMRYNVECTFTIPCRRQEKPSRTLGALGPIICLCKPSIALTTPIRLAHSIQTITAITSFTRLRTPPRTWYPLITLSTVIRTFLTAWAKEPWNTKFASLSCETRLTGALSLGVTDTTRRTYRRTCRREHIHKRKLGRVQRRR